jgi:hypothetical protein
MSTGAVFALIANDGKADRMIMATKLLNQRISDVMCARKRAGKADITPTLVDLERTHILFVNAHFKPFAAVGFEYNKVRAQSGNPQLGNSITYSIPQFGDFFNDMVHTVTMSSTSSSSQTAPSAATGAALTTSAQAAAAMSSTQFPQTGADWDGRILTGATYSLEDAFGNQVTAGTGTYQNLVRYVEYPGERLHQNVKFDVNGNPLDEYDVDVQVMSRKFTLSKDKTAGYNRMVGQENPMIGYASPELSHVHDNENDSTQPYLVPSPALSAAREDQIFANPAPTASAFATSNFPVAAWNAGATPTAPTGSGHGAVIRRQVAACDGPQTAKYTQPELAIWNKLCFWFNNDTRLSIPSVSIPFGQRFITISLATQAQMLSEVPGLYVRQCLDQQPTAAPALSSTDAVANSRKVSYRPFVSAGTIGAVTLSKPALYVNNIFVNPEVHDIFIKRIGFSLIRVWRQQKSTTNTETSDEKLMSQLKWPIEYMFVGMRPSHNAKSDGTNSTYHSDWHKMTKNYSLDTQDFSHAEVNIDNTNPATDQATLGVVSHRSRLGQRGSTEYQKSVPTVSSMSVTAHGINITDNFPQAFYNSYVPYNYGGSNIVTPDDSGVMMACFSLFPGSYNPSGHINVSRAREFYLKWATAYTSSSSNSELVAVAVAINFLLISDGSAVLRYST